MNILSLNNFYLNTNYNNKKSFLNNNTNRFGLTMAKPLLNDTVSFQAKTVKNLNIANVGIPMRDAKKVHINAAELQPEITQYFKKLFEPVLVSKKNPLNPIEDIRGRAKGALSIWEIAKTRDWDSLDKIFHNMTDLNGVKCVLRDSTHNGAEIALETLMNGIKSGAIILDEVEVKRPSFAKNLKKTERYKYDYVIPSNMKKFVKEAEKISGKKVNFDEEPDYVDSNYSAIHFLFRFPAQKRVFELQLMGHDVSIFKGMDDLFFKILNYKAVEPEFKPIKNLIKPLMKEGYEDYLEKFNQYRADSFIFQREKEPKTTAENSTEFFLPLKYDIPYQKLISQKDYNKLVNDFGIDGNPYDFNNLYKIYKKCRAQADITRNELIKSQ